MLQPLKLIFFSLLITSYSLSAQSQLKSDIKIYKNIGIIKNATGWAYNNQENSWTDHPNYIKKNIAEEEPSTHNKSTTISKAYQNFDSINLKTINYKNHFYYLLIVKCLEGKYTYPTLKKDWNYQSETKIFIFEETDINNLKSLNDYLCITTSRKIVITSKIENDEEFISNIKRELIRLPSKSSKKYTFVIRKLDNESVHFLLPQRYVEDPIETIQNKYFEISLKDYYKFLGLKTQDKSLY
ncbi:hypothetical protein ZPR_4466 [Zunongwangia profunda SM-A87]|uniref:Uncharacterized protein n=1 Tax=Zunongwangia profunda (strain DSM 18752 / CCTCC AB 206139 / SM-A87) TaxID=655815 RepID=D5BCE1_ZUNPS|nr:hypothetical protein [Zunongwangia profunda]ADF54767.1 hypothetical protein ZPR_4466 [Zunongwangia profunda SM-A87]